MLIMQCWIIHDPAVSTTKVVTSITVSIMSMLLSYFERECPFSQQQLNIRPWSQSEYQATCLRQAIAYCYKNVQYVDKQFHCKRPDFLIWYIVIKVTCVFFSEMWPGRLVSMLQRVYVTWLMQSIITFIGKYYNIFLYLYARIYCNQVFSKLVCKFIYYNTT